MRRYEKQQPSQSQGKVELPKHVRIIQQLIAKHERTIRDFIARRSGPQVLKRATADDMFQETVAAACESARTFEFRSDGSFVAWISTIARRVIARYAAGVEREPHTFRIKRQGSTGAGVYETELGSRGRTPSSLVASQERRAALLEAIRNLPPLYRRVLTLYKIEERPLDEVASIIGREKTATCHLIARAIRKLSETLVDDEHVGPA
jgi:RNA polymerase sigma factor (sigma-70 family)